MLFRDADGLDRVRINVLNPKMHTVHIASLLKILKEKVAEQGKQPEQQGRVITIAKAWKTEVEDTEFKFKLLIDINILKENGRLCDYISKENPNQS